MSDRLTGDLAPPGITVIPFAPEDIVPAAIILAASDSDSVTGQVIPIEGGMILV